MIYNVDKVFRLQVLTSNSKSWPYLTMEITHQKRPCLEEPQSFLLWIETELHHHHLPNYPQWHDDREDEHTTGNSGSETVLTIVSMTLHQELSRIFRINFNIDIYQTQIIQQMRLQVLPALHIPHIQEVTQADRNAKFDFGFRYKRHRGRRLYDVMSILSFILEIIGTLE